jgi:hypothetical protein
MRWLGARTRDQSCLFSVGRIDSEIKKGRIRNNVEPRTFFGGSAPDSASVAAAIVSVVGLLCLLEE